MTLPVEEAAEIAKGLTTRVAACILEHAKHGPMSSVLFPKSGPQADALGLTIIAAPPYVRRLTPLGIAVSRHLSQTAKSPA